MTQLHLVNSENRLLAEIALDSENRLQLTAHHQPLEAPLRELLAAAQRQGVKQRVSRKIDKGGSTLIAEDLVTVMPGEADFLRALADEIGSRRFGTPRVFALVVPGQAGGGGS